MCLDLAQAGQEGLVEARQQPPQLRLRLLRPAIQRVTLVLRMPRNAMIGCAQVHLQWDGGELYDIFRASEGHIGIGGGE